MDVSGLSKGVSALDSSNYHTCAVTTSSLVKCWGKNDYYQLGTTSVTYSATALQIAFPTAYTYGDPAHKHAVTALNTGESYTYDADGNMITRVEGGVTYTQSFNAENRLVSVTVGTQTTQFVYDGDGNQIKQVNPDGSKTIRIDGVYEEDRNSGGTVTGTRVYYAAGGAMRVNGTVYYVVGDNLGSAVLALDASGNTVGQERYFPFGSIRFASGSMQTDRLYTGQRSLTSLGLMDYHARFYDPYLNRFISPDSIVPSYANPQSLNRYSYGLNDPVKYSDPTGHNYCDRINRNNAEDCNGGESRINKRDSLERLRRQHEMQSRNEPKPAPVCYGPNPCISIGGTLPSTSTFHPLDNTVMSQVPIYDYSHYPPRIIGYHITSYADDSVHVDSSTIAMGGIRAFLPIPNLAHPLSVDNADVAYKASEHWIIHPITEALESFHIESVCEVCGPIGIGLKALGLIQAANEGITIDAHLRSYDTYFPKPPITTPLDQLP